MSGRTIDEILAAGESAYNKAQGNPVPVATHLSSLSTHVKSEQPSLFKPVACHYVVPPPLFKPVRDTKGPFAGQVACEGPAIRVTYKENGREYVEPDAYWSPTYPGWVAAASLPAVNKLKQMGYLVLEIEESHDARCHHGGPCEQCDNSIKYSSPCCLNLYQNPEMRKKYGQSLTNAYNMYQRQLSVQNGQATMATLYEYQQQRAYNQAVSTLMGVATQSSDKKDGKKTTAVLVEQSIPYGINSLQMPLGGSFGFISGERASSAGHAMAQVLGGRAVAPTYNPCNPFGF